MAAHFRCPSCGGVNQVREDRLADGPKCGACHTRLDVTNAPFHVTDDDLDRLVQKSPVPVLVDFYADWCGPCRSLAPVLQELAKRHAGQLFVAKVDTEAHHRMASQLGVSGIPAMFLYKGGQVVDKTTGARPIHAMEAFVGKYL